MTPAAWFSGQSLLLVQTSPPKYVSQHSVNGILNRNVAFGLQEDGSELLTYFTFNYSVFPSHTLR